MRSWRWHSSGAPEPRLVGHDRWFRRLVGSAAGAVITVCLASCGSSAAAKPSPPDPLAGAFVAANGSSFSIGGLPYRFVGFNLFDAAAAGGPYHCVSDHWVPYTAGELDAALAYMHDKAGATVLRFWAYQTYTRSATDWSGMDLVIALARSHGMRVLPVLEDGPGYCTSGQTGVAKWHYQGDTWYYDGYKTTYGGAALSYRDYVERVVAHYADNPTILGWQLMNEATTSLRIGGKSVLVDFGRDIGTLIHSLDRHHLVTLGTESDGFPGASGPDFTAVNSLPQIDFASAHDYAGPGQPGRDDPTPLNGLAPGGNLPSPSSSTCQAVLGAPLACSVAADVATVRKPMVIDEVGVSASSANRSLLANRAGLFDRKFAAMYAHGVSGVLVWDFNKVDDVSAGNFDVLSSVNDPLIPIMHAWAGRIAPHH